MQTSVEIVSPCIAEMFLKNIHPNQRRVRKETVQMYARIMRRGDWVLTPDGIAFDNLDRLIQGNHRLRAVIEAGVSIPFNVTRGACADAFQVLDQGMKRNGSDATGIDRKLLEVSNVILRIARSNLRLDITESASTFRKLENPIREVFAQITATNHRGLTAATRSGVLIHHLRGTNLLWLAKKYNDLALDRLTELSSIQTLFYKRINEAQKAKNRSQGRQVEQLATALKVFDPAFQDKKKLYLTDLDLEHAREECEIIVDGG
jgi:hypothetical protein